MTDPGPLPELDSSNPPHDSARSGLFRWLLPVMAAAFVLSSVAPGLPPAWKRLGLMYAVLGGLIGVTAGWLTGRVRSTKDSVQPVSIGESNGQRPVLPPPRRLIWFVLLATLGALINTAFVSARQHRLAVEAGMARDPQTRAYLEMLRSAARTDPESAAQLEQINRRMSI
jgi:hypothetical protein